MALASFVPSAAHAKDPPPPLPKTALEALARDFVQKIGGKLKEFDATEKAAKNSHDSLSLIPDGEVLLLRPKLDRFVMDTEIAAMRESGITYYSLNDLLTQLELAIDYKPQTKIASGWFLREDWLFRMDLEKKEVVSRGKTFVVSGSDYREVDGETYISEKAANTWLAVDTKPDLAQQYLEIRTPYPIPPYARYLRGRGSTTRNARNEPQMPRYEQEQKNFDINTAEIQQNMRMKKNADGDSTTRHSNITSIQGDVLKHSLYATSQWDNQEKLTNIRGRLSKESEDPVLLGKLGARSYTLGDTDTTALPLTGGTTQELGARISNSPLRNNDFQSTTISGDALPGWDVELYRDGILVDRIQVDDTARYAFNEVDLYAGDNIFEVFFYGPQGEIRQDQFNLPVTESLLAQQDGTYDVSLTFAESQLFSKIKSDDEDANTPHLVARYNKIIGNTLTHVGVNVIQDDSEQKLYTGTGFTNVTGGIVFSGNAAVDEKGATAAELDARKTISDWRLGLTTTAQDEKFSSSDDSPNILSVAATANKTFQSPFDTFSTFNTTGLYGVRADDSTQTLGQMGISTQYGRFNLSNTWSYEQIENLPDAENPEPTLSNFLAARMGWGNVFTRVGVNYNVKPETKVDSYVAQVNYRPSRKIGTDLTVEHDPDEKLTQGRLNVNYTAKQFRLSPYVGADSDRNMEAGVKLTTTLVDQEGSAFPEITSDRLIGRGMVSAFVFYDKNGNNIFDGTDEALPDVMVDSVNVPRKSLTDQKGYSLIKDLPENFATDIVVDKSTLPDPFMVSGLKGVSVFPRAGQKIDLSFPIHMGGEVSGTVEMRQADGSQKVLSSVSLDLIPVQGKQSDIIKAVAASDGFYDFSSVPPGNYLLSVNSQEASRFDAGGAAPKAIQISYDGTILENQNFILDKDRKQVPVEIKPYKGRQYLQPFFALQTGASKSRTLLSSLLSNLIEGRTGIKADNGLTPLSIEGEEDLKVLAGQDWQAHYDRCQLLNDAKIPCRVLLFMPDDKNAQNHVVAQK